MLPMKVVGTQLYLECEGISFTEISESFYHQDINNGIKSIIINNNSVVFLKVHGTIQVS